MPMALLLTLLMLVSTPDSKLPYALPYLQRDNVTKTQ